MKLIQNLGLTLATSDHNSPMNTSGSAVEVSAVFIGELNSPTCSGVQRSWALEQCGINVINIDTTHYRIHMGRLGTGWVRFTEQFHLLYDQDRLENDIMAASVRANPALIWFEWPRSFPPYFIQRLRSACPAAKLISFQDDNPFGTRYGDAWQWKRYLQCIPFFDVHLVKRQSDLQHLATYGARDARLWMHGVYRPLFQPPTTAIRKLYPVSFVGTCFDDRPKLFEFLIARCRLPVHVFGSHWKKRSFLPRTFPQFFHPEVTGCDYVQVIQQSIVSLGLVSKSNQDDWSLRTFEIPGCAALLLAQRTATHERMFKEGTEAAFFSDPAECATAIRDLLREPERALRIGKAAFKRCKEQGWFIEDQMRTLLAHFRFSGFLEQTSKRELPSSDADQ